MTFSTDSEDHFVMSAVGAAPTTGVVDVGAVTGVTVSVEGFGAEGISLPWRAESIAAREEVAAGSA